MDNVVVTPHIASNTGAGRTRMERMAFEQVTMALGGRTPTHLLNPLVLGAS
jgi:phosphoglycerate dehydrogenase-like enzyme